MLALAGSAAVPIVLHLIMRRSPKHVLFPALRFVQQRSQANRRRLRLRHLILLALRVALFCLLAFALARPSIRAPGFQAEANAPVSVALVVDTGPAMDYEHLSQTRLDVAKEIARWLLEQLPSESQVAVLDSRGGGAVFQVDVPAAIKRAEQLKTTVMPDRYANVAADAVRVLKEGKYPARELYLVTDLTRSAWSEESAATLRSALAAAPDVAVQVIDVGAINPQNTSLGPLALDDQILARNAPLRIRCDVGRLGETAEKTIHLAVRGPDGQLETRDQKTVRLADGESNPVEFTLLQREPGTHQGELRIVGRDGLAADDRRYFTVEVKPPWRVLIAAPSPPEHHAFDLHEALAPEPLRLDNQARYQCDVVPLLRLADVAIDDYAAVALLDPTNLSPAVWEKLARYARAGGSVAVFLGRNADATNFNSAPAQALLPGKLLQQARWPDGKLALQPQNYQHPALSGLRPYKDRIPWERFPVFRFWQLDEAAPDARVVVPYSNGQPALFERIVGEGTVVTMTTPVSDELDDTAWNILPTGLDAWPFVALANELFSYLVGAADEQLNYEAAGNLMPVLHLEGNRGIPGYKLVPPTEGSAEIRSSNPADPKIVVGNLEEAGNYRVVRVEDNIDRGFSVNISPTITELRRVSESELKALLGEAPFKLARNREEITRNYTIQRVGREMFPLMILIVVAVLVAEHVLANRFYREPGQPAKQ
jgi:hypothetical protein